MESFDASSGRMAGEKSTRSAHLRLWRARRGMFICTRWVERINQSKTCRRDLQNFRSSPLRWEHCRPLVDPRVAAFRTISFPRKERQVHGNETWADSAYLSLQRELWNGGTLSCYLRDDYLPLGPRKTSP